MGGATVATVAVTAAKKIYDNQTERKQRSAELKHIRNQKSINDSKKKNILEEQLAKRRAKVGSMGVSTSGSAMAVQDKIVSDNVKDISYDNYNYDTQYAKNFNAYQAKLRSQILSESSNVINKIIK